MSSGNDAQDAVNDLLEQYEKKLGDVAPKSVGIQLAFMAALSLVTVMAFSILRPKNKLIYAPKTKYSTPEKQPPKVDDGLFSWVKPLILTKEPQMLVEMGLDAVVFLRFLRMCRWLFTAVALLTCGVLIPLNIIYNLNNVPVTQRNFLSTLTISNVRGTFLWAHVAMSYLICFLAFWFIWFNYKRVVDLKHAYFRSKEYQNSLHARSLMITGVQRQYQTDEGLQGLLAGLNIPYPTSAVHIGRRVGQLPELVDAHNDAVRELEQILTTYTKGGKLGPKRPTKTIGGFLGIGGKKVDAIEYMTAKIKRLEDMVQQHRDTITDKKSEPYGFASFAAVPYAHVVGKKLQSKRIKGCEFSLAPLPSDIIWRNLARSHQSKFWKKFLIAILLVALCGLYTIPLVAVSFLANLAAITQYVGFLNAWSVNSEWSFSAFVGIAPPLLSALLQLLLPFIMRKLIRKRGLITKNQVDRSVLAKYWAFLIITQLIIFSLLGVVFNLITELVIEFGKGGQPLRIILQEVNKLPARIQNTYLSQSNYWLTWLPLRLWAAVFDLAQVLNLILVWAKARLFGRTPREIREWTKPPKFDYAVYIANSLLIVAVAFVYAPLAPLVPLLAAFAFFASSMIYKQQLLYVAVTGHESGGRMWRVAINRMLICLVFQQAILTLTIGLQQGWIRSVTCAPPVVLIIVFKIILSRTFDERFDWYMPSDQEVSDAVVHHSDVRKNRLHKRFGNPALHADLFTPMIHKKSQHLLRQIYSGRLAEDDYVEMYNESQKVMFGGNDAATGGLNFKAVEEDDLQQSREAYLREQEAWETGSQSTAVTGDTPMYRGPQSDYFEAAKRDYLANGPGGMNGSHPGTPGSFELSRVHTNATSDVLLASSGRPGESRENLLYGGQVGANFAGRGAGLPGAFLPPLPRTLGNNAYGRLSNPAPYQPYEDMGTDYYAYDRRYSNPALNNTSSTSLPPGAGPSAHMEGGPNGTPAPSYPQTFAYPPSSQSWDNSPPQQYQSRYSPPLYRGQAHNPPSRPQSQYDQQLGYGHRQQPSNSSQHSLGRFNNTGGYYG